MPVQVWVCVTCGGPAPYLRCTVCGGTRVASRVRADPPPVSHEPERRVDPERVTNVGTTARGVRFHRKHHKRW